MLKISITIHKKKLMMKILSWLPPLGTVIGNMIMHSIRNLTSENKVKYSAKVNTLVTREISRLNSKKIMKYSQKGNSMK